MRIPPVRNLPEENEIVDLLARFKPQPTERLNRIVASAPWHRPALTKPAGSPNRPRISPRLAWGLACLIVILIGGAIAFIPPIRAIARQIIFSFTTAPSSQIRVEVTPANPRELFNLNDPANFSLTVEQAAERAGFPVRQITPTPAVFKLVGARYEVSYNAVILYYQAEGYTLFLTQRLLGKGQDVFTIGPNAHVELVRLEAGQGEYVQGGWVIVSTQPVPGSSTPESPLSVSAVWDDSLPQSTLRWQAGSMANELRAVGEAGPSQSDLILWANELK